MAGETRITHAIVEVLRDGDPKARITHALTEVLRKGDPKARITHAAIEVLRSRVATVTSTVDLDALLHAVGLTKTSDLDAVLTALIAKEVDLDAILHQIKTRATSLDAVLASATETKTSAADLDAILHEIKGLEAVLDAVLHQVVEKVADLDAYLKQTLSHDADLDAYLKKVGEKAADLDASLEPPGTARAYGEESPSQGEYMISWATWLMSDGGAVSVLGDADWGKLQLYTGEIAQGPVFQLGIGTWPIGIIKNRYGSGTGSFKTWVRGSTTNFSQLAGSPSWEEWTGVVDRTWTYGQVRLEGL